MKNLKFKLTVVKKTQILDENPRTPDKTEKPQIYYLLVKKNGSGNTGLHCLHTVHCRDTVHDCLPCFLTAHCLSACKQNTVSTACTQCTACLAQSAMTAHSTLPALLETVAVVTDISCVKRRFVGVTRM